MRSTNMNTRETPTTAYKGVSVAVHTRRDSHLELEDLVILWNKSPKDENSCEDAEKGGRRFCAMILARLSSGSSQ